MLNNNRPKQAVILAGGLGTRLRPITNTLPKPMIPFHGKPFLEYILEMLIEQGFEKAVILLGYLPEKVIEYFGDGKNLGISIEYSITDISDDTGLRLTKAKHLIDQEFMLLYCDNYWPIDFEKMWKKYCNSKVSTLVTVYLNKDNYTNSNIKIDKNDFIEVYDKTRTTPNLQGVDIGFFIMKKEVLDLIPEGNHNFEKTVMPILIESKQIITYPTEHRYYSVGSHERLKLTEKFLERSKTIIIDRDGILNRKAPKAQYILNWSEWQWLNGSIEAIVKLKSAGYQIIVVTNQAGIARGLMSEKDLNEIHKKMNEDLAKFGGRIDKIYYCPHGWDENCECRKPKAGMLYYAQKDFHLDLTKIWFIGDDERDVIAGKVAGMKTAKVEGDNGLLNFINSKVLD